MGIKRGFVFLNRRYPNASGRFNRRKLHHFRHVLFDFNNMLYSNSYTRVELLKTCHNQVIRLLRHTTASDSVYLALDGTAPMAKMLVQRDRRLFVADSLRKDLFFYGGERQRPATPLELMPCTSLMTLIRTTLMYTACDELERRKSPKLVATVSGSDVSGEGEFKIFETLNELAARDTDQSALVVSGDSDALLFAVLSRYSGLSVLRTAGKDTALYDIEKLKADVLADLLPMEIPRTPETVDAVLTDFVLMTILLGSDFTSALRGYDYPVTLRNYRRWRTDQLAQGQEPQFLFDTANHAIDWCAFAKIIHSIPIYGSEIPPADDVRKQVLVERFPTMLRNRREQAPDNVIRRMDNFACGLIWTVMYLKGECLDQTYLYAFDTAPVYRDVELFAEHLRATNSKNPSMPNKQLAPVFAGTALLALTPLRYQAWIPSELHQMHNRACAQLNQAWESIELEPSSVADTLLRLNEEIALEIDRLVTENRHVESADRSLSALASFGSVYTFGTKQSVPNGTLVVLPRPEIPGVSFSGCRMIFKNTAPRPHKPVPLFGFKTPGWRVVKYAKPGRHDDE